MASVSITRHPKRWPQMMRRFPTNPVWRVDVDLREKIREMFNQMWVEDHDTPPPVLNDDTVLLETGFDSMSFAVLVTQLDEDLGFDPFSMDEEAVYPATFGEFVAFYNKHATNG